jgi:hypothetical protein
MTACSSSATTAVQSFSASISTPTSVPDTPIPIPTATDTLTLAPSPTATLPPPPTTVLIPRLYTIDLTRSDTVPTDLKEFVFGYHGSAGGGGPCWGGDGTPAWSEAYENISIAAFPQTLQWVAHNLPPNQTSNKTLLLPDGSILSTEESTGDLGCIFYTYDVVPGSQLGVYSIELSVGNIVLTDSILLETPKRPTRMVYQGNEWFAGFDPNEQVKLWIYYGGTISEFLQPDFASLSPGLPDLANNTVLQQLPNQTIYVLIEEQVINADEYGTFRVKYTSEQINLVDELGEITGSSDGSRITTVAEGESSGLTDINRFGSSCNGSLPTQLKIGDEARVTSYGDVAKLSPGDTVTIVLGPICESSYRPMTNRWEWIVNTTSQTSLLVSECDAEGYFLEPVVP